MSSSSTRKALVRSPGPELVDGLSENPTAVKLDFHRALAQHQGYVMALHEAGLEVLSLPLLPGHADCCFVEDCAVVLGGRALITRPGAASRQGEVESVGAALEPYLELSCLTAPATLDGGDVMRLGDRIFVGDSSRTNKAGRDALAAFAAEDGIEVITVPVRGALHLKSVASPAGDGVVVVLDGAVAPDIFGSANVIVAPLDEARAANVLDLGSVVLVPPECPETREALRRAQLNPVEVDASEFALIDGALTCLSIIFET